MLPRTGARHKYVGLPYHVIMLKTNIFFYSSLSFAGGGGVGHLSKTNVKKYYFLFLGWQPLAKDILRRQGCHLGQCQKSAKRYPEISFPLKILQKVALFSPLVPFFVEINSLGFTYTEGIQDIKEILLFEVK